MCVIVLGPRSNHVAFVVIVILIADVPVQTSIDLERQPPLGRLETHRIRRDQGARIAGRISDAATLATVPIDAIRGKKRQSWSELSGQIRIEEIVSDVVKTATQGMTNIVEEKADDGVAVDPVVVVARVYGDF